MSKHLYPHFKPSTEWLITIMSLFMIFGIAIDGWAHNHIGVDLHPFFTPYHAVLYGAYGVTALIFFYEALKNHKEGFPLRRLLPKGYGLSMIGIIAFGLAGFFDMIWHLFLGVEVVTMDITLSPAHLLLAFSGMAIMSGAWRSLWHHRELPVGLWNQLPFIFSFAFTLMPLLFMLQWANPWVYPWVDVTQEIVYPYFIAGGILDAEFLGVAMGAASMLIIGTLLTIAFLHSLKRFMFPVGGMALTLVFTASYLIFMRDGYSVILYVLIVGLVLEWVFAMVRKLGASKVLFVRLFSVLFPLILWLGYFAWINVVSNTSWSMHVFTGELFLLAATGFLLGHVIISDKDAASIELPRGVTTTSGFLLLGGISVFGVVMYLLPTQTSLHSILQPQFNRADLVQPPVELLPTVREFTGRDDFIIYGEEETLPEDHHLYDILTEDHHE